MENVKEIINNLMINKGLRRKRDVAAFFGVSPQALSFWISKGEIPPKHLLKLSQQNIMINPSEPSLGHPGTPLPGKSWLGAKTSFTLESNGLQWNPNR